MIACIKIGNEAPTGPLTWDYGGGRYWDRTSDLFGVKAASTRYPVPGSTAADAVTWVYVLGLTACYWRVLEGLFPLCSFNGRVINLVQVDWARAPQHVKRCGQL
jgi:hypothetical protein